MRKALLLIILISGLSGYSQEVRKNSYGITAGLGGGFTIHSPRLMCDCSQDIGRSITIGINYYRQLNNNLKLESSINWYQTVLTATPTFYPGQDMTPTQYDLQLIYISIFLRINLSKYFYFHGGLIADDDISKIKYIYPQTGLGAGIGIGTEFSVLKHMMVQINPYTNLHALFPTTKGNYFPGHILDYGIKIGIRTK